MSHDSKRDLTITVVLSLTAVVWAAFLARPGHAQQLDPLAAVHAYTTDHPNPEGAEYGLATPDGRFAITPMQGCDWLAPGQDVYIYPNFAVPPWLGISGTDATEPGCVVRVEGRMSATPCFSDAMTARCEVALERD